MKRVHNGCMLSHRRPGFTLLEVLVCAVLIGLGFVALVAAFGHDTVITQRSEDMTLGTFLADEIRGLAFQMDLPAILAMDNTTFNPAVLSTGAPQNSTDWSQHLVVTPVSVTDLNTQVAPEGAKAVRITVEVRLRGNPVVTQTYFAFDMEGVPFTDVGG